MPYNFLEPLNFTYFARSGLLPTPCQYSSLSVRLYNLYCTTKVTRRHSKLQENKAAYKESTEVIYYRGLCGWVR